MPIIKNNIHSNKSKRKGFFLMTSAIILVGGSYLYSQYSEVDVKIICHGITQQPASSTKDSTLLSVAGIQQANDIGDIINKTDAKVEVIYSSPIEHDRTMASIIAAKTNAKLVIDEQIGYELPISIASNAAQQTEKDRQSSEDKANNETLNKKPKILQFFDSNVKCGSQPVYIVTGNSIIKNLYEYTNAKSDNLKIEPASLSTFKYNIFSKKLSFVGYKNIENLKASINQNKNIKEEEENNQNKMSEKVGTQKEEPKKNDTSTVEENSIKNL